MKQYMFIWILALLLVSCGGRSSSSEKAETGEAQKVKKAEQSAERKVNATSSVIKWKGFKPGGGHHGTLSLKEGMLEMKEGVITGGRFVIDMNSIVDEDLDNGNSKKLISHLKSADFFDVEKYPTGEFVITSVLPKQDTTYEITGNLTLKGNTKSISFPADVFVSDWSITASTQAFTIDRTQWGVNYGSKNIFKNLADSFINDEIEVQIRIITE